MTASEDGPIPIDESSRTAAIAQWAAMSGGMLVDAVDVGGRRELAFAPRQLLVDSRNPDVIAEFAARYGAEVVEEAPLPPPPEGMAPRDGLDMSERPRLTALRFRELPDVSERGAHIVRERLGARATLTSRDAAKLLSLAAESLEDGLPVELDVVGSPVALPLTSATDSNPEATFSIPALRGRARVTAAWQLVEAFRAVKRVKPLVTVGVLDTGFWLAGRTPLVAVNQSGSDLGAAVMQLNLLDERVGAGGASGSKCGDAYSCPWHGNQMAGIATAKPNNFLGTAGTGGTVAVPVLFKTAITKSQTYRCLAVCLAWGVDVLNISWEMSGGNFLWGDGSWVDSFRFATSNGLIVVCAAGNDNENVPDESAIRPATRTPGTITVGASNPDGDAWQMSNHGSSVDIWAPGVRINTIPDGDSPTGAVVDGTSAASPFVAGVVAMMRAVNPSIDSESAKQILRRTAWAGPPGSRADRRLDAYAAVLEAMGGRLPEDLTEPNQTAASARRMQPRGGPGQLGTMGKALAVLSGAGDADWHSFTVSDFSTVDIQAAYYPLLGSISLTMLTDDPDSRATDELVVANRPGVRRLHGTVAPGGYRLRVGGGVNMYELTVTLQGTPLPRDEMEFNDSFEAATRFSIARASELDVAAGPTYFERRAGSYDLTLHDPTDHDFFRIATGAGGFSRPLVRVGATDAPVDVILYDAGRTEFARASGIRHTEMLLPTSTVTYVEITSNSPTRYRLTAREEVDQRKVPGPFQEEVVFRMPDPGDPPFRLDERINYLLFTVDELTARAPGIRLASVEGVPLSAEVLDSAGQVVSRAFQSLDGPRDAMALNTAALPPGTYVVRLGALEASGMEGTGLHVEAVVG